ncbi:MAG: T9SS type A sorting domain-containing protein [Ignavibacteria bacterium]
MFLLISLTKGYSQEYWLSHNSPTSRDLTSVFFIDSLNGWIGGDSGYIIHTTDKGKSWINQSTGVNNSIHSLYFLNDHRGFALSFEFDNTPPAYFGTRILTTSDGGNTWNNSLFPDSNIFLSTIFFIDSLKGFTGGSNGIIYYTTNTGETWLESVIDSAQIFGVSPLLTHLNDGTGNFQDYFIGSDNFYGRAYATGDFDNDGDLDVAGSLTSSKVAILLNGDIPLPVELSSLTSETVANNVTLSWATSSEENNAGYDIERSVVRRQMSDEWSKIGFVQGNGNSNSVHNYTFTDKNLQSGKYKYRLKQTDFNGNFKYYELSNEVTIGVPDKFYLSQNYPNPFNPTSNLGFGISELGFVSLKVYDAQGKEVATLVNETKAPGYYNIQFSATGGGSNLASGVYYYRLEAGGFVQTKRMMLLK